MNKFSAYRITRASLLKYYIHGTFIRHKADTLQDALIVHLGAAMLVALRWPVIHQLLRIHFAPVHFSTDKRPTGTLDAGREHDNFKPRTSIHQPPHQPKVAPRQSLSTPQLNYEALHGLFGHLMELD